MHRRSRDDPEIPDLEGRRLLGRRRHLDPAQAQRQGREAPPMPGHARTRCWSLFSPWISPPRCEPPIRPSRRTILQVSEILRIRKRLVRNARVPINGTRWTRVAPRLSQTSSCDSPAQRTSTLATSNGTWSCRARSCRATVSGPPTMKLMGWPQRSWGRAGSGVSAGIFPSWRNRRQRMPQGGLGEGEGGRVVRADEHRPVGGDEPGAARLAVGRGVLPVLLGRPQVGEQHVETERPGDPRRAGAIDRQPASARQVRRRDAATGGAAGRRNIAARRLGPDAPVRDPLALQAARMIRSASANRAWRSCSSVSARPKRPNSSGVLPLPNPTAIRPFVSTSATATCSATSSGWWRFRQMIAVPRRIRRVWPARCRREEQGRRQVPVMGVRMVLGEPGVLHAQLVGQPDQVRDLIKDHRRRTIPRSLEMVGQADFEQAHDRFPPVRDAARHDLAGWTMPT